MKDFDLRNDTLLLFRDDPREDSVQTLVSLYEEIGVDMYFDDAPSPDMIDAVPVSSELSREEIRRIVLSCCRA